MGLGSHAMLQPKLMVGQANDPLENEADRVAERVMSMRAPEHPVSAPHQTGGKSTDLEQGGHAQPLQAKLASASEPASTAAPGIAQQALRSPGQPLDPSTRSYFEPRFGADFSGVRIHGSGLAHKAAAAVNAKAFTVGSHLVFAAGHYAPSTERGKQLLAHELTHVVQQAGGPAVMQRAPDERDEIKMPEEYVGRPNNMRLGGKVRSDIVGPKPIGLMSMDYSGSEAHGGRAYTDDMIYGPTNEANARIDKANQKAFEASIAAKPVNEADQKARIASERAKFRSRNSKHGKARLDNMDTALGKVTEKNPHLLIAYYEYYAKNELGDDPDKGDMATTKRGVTDLPTSLLDLDPGRDNIVTSDAASMLGSTMMHEFIHVFQGSDVNQPKEDKAWGAEYALSGRMNDAGRQNYISERYQHLDWDTQTRYKTSMVTVEALYDVVDKGKSNYRALEGVTADRARELIVEYMTTGDPKNYSYQLKRLMAEISK